MWGDYIQLPNPVKRFFRWVASSRELNASARDLGRGFNDLVWLKWLGSGHVRCGFVLSIGPNFLPDSPELVVPQTARLQFSPRIIGRFPMTARLREDRHSVSSICGISWFRAAGLYQFVPVPDLFLLARLFSKRRQAFQQLRDLVFLACVSKRLH